MTKTLTWIATAALLVTPAFAHARGLDSNLPASLPGPFKLEVVVSEDLAHRAENLPKKLSDRSSSNRLSSGFANNGKYGQKDVDMLVEDMREELIEDFGKRGIALSDTAPTLIRVLIDEVKPNRPTFNQLSEEPSLSFDSFGIGGADVTAEIVGAGGAVLGTLDYEYYTSLNDRPFGGVGVWTDTKRAFSRFSKQASKKLAKSGASTS